MNRLSKAYQLKANARVDRYCRRIEALAEKRGIPLKELQTEADRRSDITRSRRRQRWEKEGRLITNQDLFEMNAKAKSRNGNSAASRPTFSSHQTDSHDALELRYLRSCAARCRCNAGRTSKQNTVYFALDTILQGFHTCFQAVRSFFAKTLSLTLSRTPRK